MVHQENGEHSDKPYLNETTTPVTTVEFLQLLQSTTSHPSSRGATITQVISLLLVQIATTLKAIEQKNSTSKTETTKPEDK
jgi:hypothetical protein